MSGGAGRLGPLPGWRLVEGRWQRDILGDMRAVVRETEDGRWEPCVETRMLTYGPAQPDVLEAMLAAELLGRMVAAQLLHVLGWQNEPLQAPTRNSEQRFLN